MSERRTVSSFSVRCSTANASTAIEDAINADGYDEIIISTLPARVSRWLHLDLPHKAAGLGLPVTTVTARSRESAGV